MEIYGFTFSATDIWLLTICGALIMALVGYRLTLNVQRYNAFNAAATTFRNTVLTNLVGLYPVTSYWTESNYPRFHASIPNIESAAVEFRRYLTSKTSFNAAVKEYAEFCRTIKYGEQERWEMYTTTRKQLSDTTPEPRKEFERIVEHLLSFANKKE